MPHVGAGEYQQVGSLCVHLLLRPCRCDSTISLFKGAGSKPVLGMCRGEQQAACGALGQQCCRDIDQAGWEWRTCEAGGAGVFCGADNVCVRCPSAAGEAGMSQAVLAALALPGIGNAC